MRESFTGGNEDSLQMRRATFVISRTNRTQQIINGWQILLVQCLLMILLPYYVQSRTLQSPTSIQELNINLPQNPRLRGISHHHHGTGSDFMYFLHVFCVVRFGWTTRRFPYIMYNKDNELFVLYLQFVRHHWKESSCLKFRCTLNLQTIIILMAYISVVSRGGLRRIFCFTAPRFYSLMSLLNSCNHHFVYSATILRYLCVSMPTTVKLSFIEMWTGDL